MPVVGQVMPFLADSGLDLIVMCSHHHPEPEAAVKRAALEPASCHLFFRVATLDAMAAA